MRRTTCAALAATVALPLLAAPATAQTDPYGYTPGDDIRYDWRQDDPREREGRWSDRGGTRGGHGDGHGYHGYEDLERGYDPHDRRRMSDRYGPAPYDSYSDERAYRRDERRMHRADRYDAPYDAPSDAYVTRGDLERFRDEMLRELRAAYERGVRDARGDDEQVGRGDDTGRGWHGMAQDHGHMSRRDGPHGRGGRAMARAHKLIELYDTDGDQRVTQEEVDRFRADRLTEFDTDNDSALTLQEYEALYLDAIREALVDRFQEHDADGDGRVTVEEFSRATRNTVGRWDRDMDSAISPADFGRHRRGHVAALSQEREDARQRRPQLAAPLDGTPEDSARPVGGNDDVSTSGPRPEVEAPLGQSPNQPAGPETFEEVEEPDEATN